MSDQPTYSNPYTYLGDPPSPSGSREDPKPAYAKRGRITIVACVPCRKRKSKCDGKRPQCGQCGARGNGCNYDMTEDQRSVTYLRERSDKLEAQRDALQALIRTLQISSDEDAQLILCRLRDGESVEDLPAQVQAGKILYDASHDAPAHETIFMKGASSYISPDRAQLRNVQYDRLMNLLVVSSSTFAHEVLARLRQSEDVTMILQDLDSEDHEFEMLQPGPTQASLPTAENFQYDSAFPFVPSAEYANLESRDGDQQKQRWTEVTADDELVEHLVDLYFTWQHGFFQNFPEKLFLRDFRSYRQKYCSSSLVNAICACGCLLSSRQGLRRDCAGDQVYVGGFFDEALESLNKLSAPDIPNTAAMYLISYIEGYRGHSSGQWMLGGRSALMALDLRLHHSTEGPEQVNPSDPSELQDERWARSLAFWGCFHVTQCNSLMLGRMPVFHVQNITTKLPNINPDEDARTWRSYEKNISQRPGARDTTFRKCAELSSIVNATQPTFHAPAKRLTGRRLVDYFEQYQHWYLSLPGMAQIRDDATDAPPPPHVICLHLYYHSAVLLLFRPFMDSDINGSNVVPRNICRQAADAISNLLMLHRRLFGTSGIWQFQLNALLMASTVHILNLSLPTSSSFFIDACDTFREFEVWQGGAGKALDSLRKMVKDTHLDLSGDVEQALFHHASSGRAPLLAEPGTRYQENPSRSESRPRGRASQRRRSTGRMSRGDHRRPSTGPVPGSADRPGGLHSYPTRSAAVSHSPIRHKGGSLRTSGSGNVHFRGIRETGTKRQCIASPAFWPAEAYPDTGIDPTTPAFDLRAQYSPMVTERVRMMYPPGVAPILAPLAQMSTAQHSQQPRQPTNVSAASSISSCDQQQQSIYWKDDSQTAVATPLLATEAHATMVLPGVVGGLTFAENWGDAYLNTQTPRLPSAEGEDGGQ